MKPVRTGQILLAACWRELLLLRRDYHALAALFLMPLVFITLMSLALKDTFSPTVNLRYAVQFDQAEDSARAEFLAAYAADIQEQIVCCGLDALVRNRADYVLVFARNFQRQLADRRARNDTAATPLIDIVAANDLPRNTLALVQSRVTMQLARQQYAQWRSDLGALLPPVERVMASQLVAARYAESGGIQPNAVQQSVPAWIVFSMFFIVIPLGNALMAEKHNGALLRLSAMRIAILPWLAGRLWVYFCVNLLQGMLMLLAGRYLVPLFGGDTLRLANPLLLLMMLAASSVAALGYGLLIAVMARTAHQANIIGALGNMLLGAVGGVMVPKLVMPPAMQRMTAWSPMGWSHEGMTQILLRETTVSELLPYLLPLLLFGAILGIWAVLRLTRRQSFALRELE